MSGPEERTARRLHAAVWLALGGLLALAVVAAPAEAQNGCVAVQHPTGFVRLGMWTKGYIGCREPATPSGFVSNNPMTVNTGLRHLDLPNGINNDGFGRSNSPTEGSSSGGHTWGLSYDSWGAAPKGRCASGPGVCFYSGSQTIPDAAITTSGAGTPPPEMAITHSWDNAVSVIQAFTPSVSPYLYKESFTVVGLRQAPIEDVLVRQTLGFYPEPVRGPPPPEAAELAPSHITLDGVMVPGALRFSSNVGGLEPNPLSPIDKTPGRPAGSFRCNGAPASRGPGSLPGAGTWFTDVGACSQGASVEFDLGDIKRDEGRTFFMYWGAAPTEALARQAVGPGPAGVDADFWFFAQSPGNETLGAPSTYIWAFSGFRGPEADFDITVPPITYAEPWVPAGYRPPGIPADAACVGSTWSFRDTSLPRDWAIVRASWDWGDGTQTPVDPYGTGPFTHTYAMTGDYTVTLTVTDGNGNRASRQGTVRVVDCPPPPPPNGCPSIEPIVSRVTTYDRWLNFTAWAADHNPYTAPDLLSFTLTVSPTPADPVPTATAAGESLRVAWLPSRGAAGLYQFTITVTDGVCSASTALTVRVLGPDPDPPEAVPDQDRDGIADPADNCMGVPNRSQLDSDLDGQGDACDSKPCSGNATAGACRASPAAGNVGLPSPGDMDGDGVPDLGDNCPRRPNAEQGDGDLDLVGDACDEDLDGDGVVQMAGVGMAGALLDNCPNVPNQEQSDQDGDGQGDACDTTQDGTMPPCAQCGDGTQATTRQESPRLPWGWIGMGAFLALLVVAGALAFALRERRAR